MKLILKEVSKPESLITFVKDRPGHDRRYAMDSTKIRTQLGWEPAHKFESGLTETIEWYVDNQPWCERVMSGEYQDYYKTMYEER